ncbi:MAG: DNA-binding response regulator [Arcobacter sp.]|nr:MAG: DNA-binding response regulator [Arcobacter sp.]
MSKRILLLEDDRLLAQTLHEILEDNAYEVDLAMTGDEAAELCYVNSYDLYIFDINVPDIDGFELLESLRNANDSTPTIFMSALVDIKNIAKGFELGAEDYLKKPFFPEELLIRVKAKFPLKIDIFISGDFSFDEQSNTYIYKEERLSLGSSQEALFKSLYVNIGKVVDKEILLECLESPSSIALRVAINKLKQTTGLDIKNLRGVGYVLEES